MCGQEGKSSKSFWELQVQLHQLKQPCRASRWWSSHRMQQSWSHGLLPPNNPAKILPPSLFLSLPFFSLLFCQLSKLSQSILELKEGQNQCQGGDGHLRPGRGGGYGERGATSSPFVCGSVLFHSWCSTFNQISLTEVSYLSKFHSLSWWIVKSLSAPHPCLSMLSPFLVSPGLVTLTL